MRLLQRLAAGMCADRAVALRSMKSSAGEAARYRAINKLPQPVKRQIVRALLLRAKLEQAEVTIRRMGFEIPSLKEWQQKERVTVTDAYSKERNVQLGIERRAQSCEQIKQRALRDLLGMDERAGKKYLAGLEKELARV